MDVETFEEAPAAQDPAIPADAKQIAHYAARQADQVNALVVEDRGQFQLETQRLRDVMTAKKNLEAMRVSVTGPLNQALLAVNGWFRGPREQLEKIERVLKDALGSFQAREEARVEAERKALEQKAREEREELERRAAAAEARGRTERAQELAAKAEAVVPAAPATAPLKARGMGFGTEWLYEVTDEALVPAEYRVLDHSKIRGVVNALKEKASIPGVRIWSRPKVSAQGNRR